MLANLLKSIPVLALLAGVARAATPDGGRLTMIKWRMNLDADGRITALDPEVTSSRRFAGRSNG